MKYILDTCVLLWLLNDNKHKIKHKTLDVVLDTSNEIYVSVISIWEISIKAKLGKIIVPDNIDKVIVESGFEIMELTLLHVLQLKELKNVHNDPFDHMLISQAISENISIISSDIIFKQYGVKLLLC